jgi:hypothetical protein
MALLLCEPTYLRFILYLLHELFDRLWFRRRCASHGRHAGGGLQPSGRRGGRDGWSGRTEARPDRRANGMD